MCTPVLDDIAYFGHKDMLRRLGAYLISSQNFFTET